MLDVIATLILIVSIFYIIKHYWVYRKDISIATHAVATIYVLLAGYISMHWMQIDTSCDYKDSLKQCEYRAQDSRIKPFYEGFPWH